MTYNWPAYDWFTDGHGTQIEIIGRITEEFIHSALKKGKNKRRVNKKQEGVRSSNMHLIGVPEVNKNNNRTEKIEDIIMENFPELRTHCFSESSNQDK